MPDDVILDVNSDQQQRSSPLMQNNNGNDGSHTLIGVGAQGKSIPITDLLENKVAKMLGGVACGWVLLVLVQGGMVGSLETKDCGFVTLLFFLVFFRCWHHYCPQAYRSFTDATQSLSADYLSIPNDIQQLAQQLALPSCYIRRLFYCSSLVSAMTSVVLSVMRLASQDFGKKKVANMESRDFVLKVFYGLTLAEALVFLFAEALSFPIEALVLLFAEALSFPITDPLKKMVAKMLGVLVCGWVLLVLVQGRMVGSLETKDCGFVTLLFFLVFFRCWRNYFSPQAYRSLTEATQSLSADYSNIPNNNQQLALPIRYIDRLFYCSRLVFAVTSVVLSVMRLASQDFGKKEVANKESRDFALKVFYGLTLAEALVLLFALTLPFPKKRNSVGLADGSGDGPEDGLGDGPADGPENGPGGEPEDGSENGLGGEPGDGSGDGPVNQSNECNAVADGSASESKQ